MKKKEKKWFWAASIIWIILLLIPVFQAQFRMFPETTLKGVIEWTKKPILTWNSWIDGSFQNDFTSWFEERIGFKAALVKTDNQINYSLFKEISASTETKVILGKNNFLYEKAYIDVWNGKNAVEESFIKKQFQDLELLSQKLAYKNIKLLFVVSPTKPASYSEYLPDSYVQKVASSSYDQVVSLMNDYDVEVIDAHSILEEHKKTSPYPTFSHGGTHWNYYGACVVSGYIVEKFGGELRCDPVTVDSKPFGTDRDLAELINLWDEHATDGETPHPTVSYKGDSMGNKVLFVGDSFTWTLTAILDPTEAYKERAVYYYNSNRYSDLLPGGEPIVGVGEGAWLDDILSHDVIIIEATHSALDNIGFGFVQELLEALS